MAFLITDIITYLRNTKSIVIATVNKENGPDLRTIGGFNFDGLRLYFATDKESNKVDQITHNAEVAVLVQHENQTFPNYITVTLYGKAKQLTKEDYDIGRNKLMERRPLAQYNEDTKYIYQIMPELIKVLDLSKKHNEQLRYIKP